MNQNKKPIKYKIEVARHDAAHCLAPGLFRSLKRGDRKKQKLDITYQYNERESLRAVGFEPLGADDMRNLQVIVGLLGRSNQLIPLSEPRTDEGKQLALLLEPKHEALKESSRTAKTNLNAFMMEAGYKTDGGQAREDLLESFRRLANVTLFVRRDKWEWSCHLLSYTVDEGDGKLQFAVNPRITEAILGERGHTHIDMREVRSDLSDPTRILHQRLCAVVDPGKQRKIGLDMLIGYVWNEPATGVTLRSRRLTIRASFAELEATGGWNFKADGQFYLISRAVVGYQIQMPRLGGQHQLI
jgi:hypothetical protein